ncbi:hypothetical protein ADUPG1_005793, partial [Aduncisulcus paluster]
MSIVCSPALPVSSFSVPSSVTFTSGVVASKEITFSIDSVDL